MQGEIAYDWNRSSSSGTLSMRLIWSYSEKVLLLICSSQTNQIKSSTHKHQRRTATSRISSVQQGSSVYLRDGRQRQDHSAATSLAAAEPPAPSAPEPPPSPPSRFAGRSLLGWARAVVLEGSGNFASKTL